MTGLHGGYESQSFIAEYYDIAYNRRRSKDVDFFVDYSKASRGRTLELGCGTGRVLIPTALAGCAITGLDLSLYMLNKCREKLAQQTPAVQKLAHLIQGDMTKFRIKEKYALVTLPFRPFQHLITTDDQKACLRCIHHHLQPHGQVIIDVFNPNPAFLVRSAQNAQEREDLPPTPLPNGGSLRRASRFAGFHRERQFNDCELIYYVTGPDGKTQRLVQSFPMRYFYRYEMEHLLQICGFKIVDMFGDFDKSGFTDMSPEMIFVAQKL